MDSKLNLSMFSVAHLHNSIFTGTSFPPSQHNSWDKGKFHVCKKNPIPLHYCLVVFDDNDACLAHF